MTTFTQYRDIGRKILTEGEMVFNVRTQQNCLTLPNQTMTYDVKNNVLPIDTTRKSFWKAAIAELLGHMRGYDNAEQYAKLGARTWFKDANQSAGWLRNPHRKGENDCGIIYGGVTKNLPIYGRDEKGDLIIVRTQNILEKIYHNLKSGIDDRGEILNFWSPSHFELGCIRPCMYSHQFTLMGDKLHLTSTSRSADWSLGVSFNSIQAFAFLMLMAQITQKKAESVFHLFVNAHIYEPHIENFREQMKRDCLPAPTLWINPEIQTLEDVLTWVTVDDFRVDGYEHHDPMSYEMFTGAE